MNATFAEAKGDYGTPFCESNVMVRTVPDLNQLVIQSPCTVDWDSMSGDDRTRMCDQCNRRVYNISKLTSKEAIALIRDSGDEICGRIFRREDGSVMTKDCAAVSSRPLKQHRLRPQFSIGALLVLITASAGFCASLPWVGEKISRLVERWSDPPPPANVVMVTMGAMDIPINEDDVFSGMAEPDVTMIDPDLVDVDIWDADFGHVDVDLFE